MIQTNKSNRTAQHFSLWILQIWLVVRPISELTHVVELMCAKKPGLFIMFIFHGSTAFWSANCHHFPVQCPPGVVGPGFKTFGNFLSLHASGGRTFLKPNFGAVEPSPPFQPLLWKFLAVTPVLWVRKVQMFISHWVKLHVWIVNGWKQFCNISYMILYMYALWLLSYNTLYTNIYIYNIQTVVSETTAHVSPKFIFQFRFHVGSHRIPKKSHLLGTLLDSPSCQASAHRKVRKVRPGRHRSPKQKPLSGCPIRTVLRVGVLCPTWPVFLCKQYSPLLVKTGRLTESGCTRQWNDVERRRED